MSKNLKVTIAPEFEAEFKKLGRGNLKFIVAKYANPTVESSPIVLAATGPKGAPHADMYSQLPPDEPRIVLYNLAMTVKTESGEVRKDKLIIMSWIPNGLVGSSGVKMKMLASTGTAYVKDFYQIAHLVQACSLDEATLEAMAEKAGRFERDPIIPGSFA